jgi:hypothetical protein
MKVKFFFPFQDANEGLLWRDFSFPSCFVSLGNLSDDTVGIEEHDFSKLVAFFLFLKRLYHKEDNHLLIFCVFSRGRGSNISQKYKSGNF